MNTNNSRPEVNSAHSDESSRISRRNVLGGLGLGAAAALSGCIAMKTPDQIEPEKYIDPEITLPSQWKKLGEIKDPRTVKDLPLSVYTSGEIYSNTPLTKRVSGVLPNRLSVPLVSLFACHINVFQTGPLGNWLFGQATPKRVINSAENTVKQVLSDDYQIRNFNEVKASDLQPEKATAHRELTGYYQIDSAPQEVELPSGKTETIKIQGSVPIRVFYSSWSLEGSEDLMLVGGAYPEVRNIKSPATITDELNKGIDVIINVDLGFDPHDARSQIVNELDSLSPVLPEQ